MKQQICIAVSLLLLEVGLGSNVLFSQPLTKSQLLAKISLTENLLTNTRQRQEQSIMDLNLVDTQLKLRLQLLKTLSEEIQMQEENIREVSDKIFRLETELADTRERYANTLLEAYKKFNPENFWLSLLSSSNLSEAYFRSKYFQQFNKYKKVQIKTIEDRQKRLKQRREALEAALAEKEALIQEKEKEISLLESTQIEQERMLKSLRSKEKSYLRKLEADRKRLRELIKEMDDSNAQAPEYNEYKDMGKAFEREKGFHYWPVPANKGVIVGDYGTTSDAFGNRIENDGVFIRTSKSQFIRTIFQGRVSGVTAIPVSGSIVIVEHGPFRSVYANLDSVAVSLGDIVGAKQVLGTVRTEPRTNESLLHFLIYRTPGKFLNPKEWIFVE